MIKDKVSVLGANDGEVKLFVPDGFTTQQTIDEAPEAAPGMFMSVAGVPIDEFTGEGAEFAEAFKPRLGGKNDRPVRHLRRTGGAGPARRDRRVGRHARATSSRRCSRRASPTAISGSFEINENGDPSGAEGAVVGFTIYKATDKLETVKTISPKPENVEAARG